MFGLGYVDPALISAVLRRRPPSASFSPFGGFGGGGFIRYPRLPAPINRARPLGPSQGLSPSAMLAAMRGAGTYYGLPQPAPVVPAINKSAQAYRGPLGGAGGGGGSGPGGTSGGTSGASGGTPGGTK